QTSDGFRMEFIGAWGMIPPDAQAAIRDYWRQGDLPACVELAQVYDPKESPAKTCLDGYHLCFDRSRVFGFPDPSDLKIAIVHELAHVYLFATRDPTHWAEPPEKDDEKQHWDDERERRVEEVLESWHVDMAKHRALWEHVRREVQAKMSETIK